MLLVLERNLARSSMARACSDLSCWCRLSTRWICCSTSHSERVRLASWEAIVVGFVETEPRATEREARVLRAWRPDGVRESSIDDRMSAAGSSCC